MPYGVEVLGLLKGRLASTELLPQSGNQLGDTWVCRTHTLGLDNAPRLGPADVGRPVSIQLTLEVAWRASSLSEKICLRHRRLSALGALKNAPGLAQDAFCWGAGVSSLLPLWPEARPPSFPPSP
jgi:hypothetical protein